MLSPILHPASQTWMLGKIESHVAKPMTLDEIEAHILDYDRLRKLCDEQSAALKWAKELLEQNGALCDGSEPPQPPESKKM